MKFGLKIRYLHGITKITIFFDKKDETFHSLAIFPKKKGQTLVYLIIIFCNFEAHQFKMCIIIMEITIAISLPQYLRQYLTGFLTRKGHNYYLSRANSVGKLINSLIDYPEGKEPETADDIKIILPYHPGKLNPYSRNFIKKENQQRIADYLTAMFDLELGRWILEAETDKLPFNKAYEIFFAAKQIQFEARNFDAVKKKDYRFRRKIETEYKKACQTLVY